MAKISKEDALNFKKCWGIVNEAEKEELRRTSPFKKMLQLTTMMRWVKDFGWNDALREEEEAVRNRWVKLKRLCHV